MLVCGETNNRKKDDDDGLGPYGMEERKEGRETRTR
jgi:hypothetical protein